MTDEQTTKPITKDDELQAAAVHWGLAFARHPLVTLVLTGFVLGTAVTAGIISGIGFRFFPLIDKSELLTTLITYGSFWGLSARLIYLGVKSGYAAAKAIFSRRPRPGWVLDFAGLYYRIPVWFFYAVVLIALAYDIGRRFLLPELEASYATMSSWATGGAAMVALLLRLRFHAAAMVFLAYVALAIAYLLGTVWVSYVKNGDEVLLIDVLDADEPIAMHVVVRGRDGLIGFVKGEPVFVPDSRVMLISKP